MKSEPIYGNLPVDLGKIDLNPTEMMFWLYCPIKLPGRHLVTVPDNLKIFYAIVGTVREDFYVGEKSDLWCDSYVYITAKTLWCSADNPGNRPGWHSDGFLTDDLNYIWYDANPTVFWSPINTTPLVSFTKDHIKSLDEMDKICEPNTDEHKRYPEKHLLKLDQTVIHKVDTSIVPGVRTFVKISVSKNKYALQGNSINHLINFNADYEKRLETRNSPEGN